ncbi:PilZ domain-containing protein [Nocardioides sp.]|uniref:PilZ domain-containing protein n=1 Tax=Nocardioides sp. TaxID=35761 RepID=UPI00261CB9EA|nr:PilZ domain-containing protein [Nocardioides sp.]
MSFSHLPAQNKTAALHTSAGGRYSVVVLRHDDELAVVGRPSSLTAAEGLDLGTTIDVTWSGTAGEQLIPAEIVRASTETGLQTWTLRTIGVPVELDRRAFRRVDVNVPMTLGIVGDLEPLATCLLVDLSEVGLRARLPRRDAAQLDPDYELAIQFTADGVEFNMLGRPLRLTAVGADVDLVDVVVLFDLTPDSRALLRTALAATVEETEEAEKAEESA